MPPSILSTLYNSNSNYNNKNNNNTVLITVVGETDNYRLIRLRQK